MHSLLRGRMMQPIPYIFVLSFLSMYYVASSIFNNPPSLRYTLIQWRHVFFFRTFRISNTCKCEFSLQKLIVICIYFVHGRVLIVLVISVFPSCGFYLALSLVSLLISVSSCCVGVSGYCWIQGLTQLLHTHVVEK